MDKNSQKAKGYGMYRAITQTFYSMLTDGKDVKVGERLMLFCLFLASSGSLVHPVTLS